MSITKKQEKAVEQAIATLRKAKELELGRDPEAAHNMADGALTRLLLDLGFEKVVLAYQNIDPKWMA